MARHRPPEHRHLTALTASCIRSRIVADAFRWSAREMNCCREGYLLAWAAMVWTQNYNPLGWVVLSAIFLYSLTVETGQFEIVKHSVLSLSDDRRLQALLIAFSFGAFVEGAAGFGTPVAISGALLLGAGFKPLYAAGLALLANTAPVAYGALGTPILTLADVTKLDALQLSAMA